jgi:hypothetical protein
MDDYKTRLLLACLAVITKRCGTGIVLTESEVEAALDNHAEVMCERDHRAHSIRLTSPSEGVRQ